MRKTGILSLFALLLACAAARATPEEPDSVAAWEQLDREYKTAEREFYKPWKDAKAKGEKCQLDYTKHPSRTFLPRFLAFAKQYRGSDEAVKALVHVIRYTNDGEERSAAVAALIEDYSESQAIRPAIWILRSRAPDTLDTLIEKSPHRDIQGFAMLARAQGLKVHLDGARIFNSAVAQGTSVKDLTEEADSVTVCLTKGLGCPVGAICLGSAEFISEARRWRQAAEPGD